MHTINRLATLSFAALMTLVLSTLGYSEEQKGPEFKEATYLRGLTTGNIYWMSSPHGMGLAAQGSHLYLSGFERALYNSQTLVAKYALPPGASPLVTYLWPNNPNVQSHYNLNSMATTSEGLFLVGNARVDAVNNYGVWATRSALVKYSLNGPTGTDVGGSEWTIRPFFYPSFNGNEGFSDVLAVKEGGATFLYATGHAEAGPDENAAAILAKFDTKGTLLWWKALGPTAPRRIASGVHLASLNGHLYVLGGIVENTLYDWGNWRAHVKPFLCKVDPSGNILWMKIHPESIDSHIYGGVGDLVGLGQHLYLTTTLRLAPAAAPDVLLLKFDEAGNLVWNKRWGSSAEDAAYAIAAANNRLYVTGLTRGWVGGGEQDVFLLEADPASGDVVSVNYHGGKFPDRAYNLLVVGGDLYILGDSYSHSDFTKLEIMLLRYALSREPPILNVKIDIKPGEAPNPINLKSKGKIPVAILSTPDFDAPKVVDKTTVTFGRTGSEPCLAPSGCKPEDVNGDGLLDLVCHFETEKAGFKEGDTQGVLKGKTLKGRPFMGIDSVVIVPPMKEKAVSKPTPPAKRIEPPRTIAPPKVEPPKSGRTAHKGKPAKTEAEALRQMQKEGGVAY